MSHRVCAVLALAGVVAAASASGEDLQTYEQCQQKAGGVTVQLQACNGAELTKRDAVLNQTYQKLLAALPAGRQGRLRNAERSWLAFADAECDFRMSAELGGTDAPLVAESCRLSLMATRIADLQQALKVAQY